MISITTSISYYTTVKKTLLPEKYRSLSDLLQRSKVCKLYCIIQCDIFTCLLVSLARNMPCVITLKLMFINQNFRTWLLPGWSLGFSNPEVMSGNLCKRRWIFTWNCLGQPVCWITAVLCFHIAIAVALHCINVSTLLSVKRGPLFTKRTDVLSQDLVKYQSHEIRV